jgi:transcriptional regulator with PAS, ATPase and Fis domain
MPNRCPVTPPLRQIIGDSPPVRHLMELVEKVGKTRVGVLLQGESGTGKEVVAEAIYNVRPDGPFVTIDCSALPTHLVESELFGYERGAFTGAATSYEGLLRAADGGTAFFDEIGELPLGAQAKFLRVLQQQEVRPLGNTRSLPCAFRVIAATNRDLQEEVRQGRFRLDLYYRLNVVTIVLPPLRERKEDIPALVCHLLGKLGYTRSVPEDLLAALMEHQWPGNVRELENCMARLVTLCSGDTLQVCDLPTHWAGTQQAPSPLVASPSPIEEPGEKRGLSMNEAERAAIERALISTNGRHAEAARALGISRTTLYRRLKAFI